MDGGFDDAAAQSPKDASPDQVSWATEARTISHINLFARPWVGSAYRMVSRANGANEAPRSA